MRLLRSTQEVLTFSWLTRDAATRVEAGGAHLASCLPRQLLVAVVRPTTLRVSTAHRGRDKGVNGGRVDLQQLELCPFTVKTMY